MSEADDASNTDNSVGNNTQKSSGLSTGAKAGIGVGVVAIAAIEARVLLVLKGRRRTAPSKSIITLGHRQAGIQ